ncbi:hypothetical protein F5Y03DRAFT_9567 [Xylaria venustula]|nr:hypothetical protein F5Y03DRAFT_9567 [Xylaria venustula]
MAPPRLKPAKKNQQPAQPVDEDDYLALADSHEEAMGKHRVGNPTKALRFLDRAVDVYSQGLSKFPRSFDLAYNKARIELLKANDPVLSEALEIPIMNVLYEALSSHKYARELAPTHPDTLYNLAQVLTTMAEIMAQEDQYNDLVAIENLEEALKILSRCFDLQNATFTKSRRELEEAMSETAQREMMQIDSEQSANNTTLIPQNATQEEQWVSIEEPTTADTLLETIIAQTHALTTLCSILSSSLPASAITVLSRIDSYSTNLFDLVLPTLLNENEEALKLRRSDIMLPKAVFTSKHLELSFKLSIIDVEEYKRKLDAAFTQSDLNAASEDVLLESAQALISMNSALADVRPETGSHASLRWNALVEAHSRLLKVAEIQGIDQHTRAKTHLLRGDISLFLQILAYPPIAHRQAQNTMPQLLKNAEGFYGNASKLFGSLGRSTAEEKTVCELKGAVVSVLQQITTGQAAVGSSSGQSDSGTTTNLVASPDQIKLAIDPILRAQGQEWVKDQIEEMVTAGLVLPSVFSAMSRC